jgi:hypothetical protein
LIAASGKYKFLVGQAFSGKIIATNAVSSSAGVLGSVYAEIYADADNLKSIMRELNSYSSRPSHVLTAFSSAGFQVTTIGRIWVTAEGGMFNAGGNTDLECKGVRRASVRCEERPMYQC